MAVVGRTPKVTAETWIDTARLTLIEEGIATVKVDRLAKRLGVTRGGFYHNFKDREDLLMQLLRHWETTCRFLPDDAPSSKPAEAVDWLNRVFDRLIESDGYDQHYDLAVREWARSDQRAAWAVERADRERLNVLQRFFEIVGYKNIEAAIRARVLYYHQIGYYAIGVRQSIPERRRNKDTYLEILCGADVLAAAREGRTRRKQPARIRARARAT